MGTTIIANAQARISSESPRDEATLKKLITHTLNDDKVNFVANRALICSALEMGGALHEVVMTILDGDEEKVRKVHQYVHSLVILNYGKKNLIVHHGRSTVLERLSHSAMAGSLSFKVEGWSKKAVLAIFRLLDERLTARDLMTDGKVLAQIFAIADELDWPDLLTLIDQKLVRELSKFSYEEIAELNDYIFKTKVDLPLVREFCDHTTFNRMLEDRDAFIRHIVIWVDDTAIDDRPGAADEFWISERYSKAFKRIRSVRMNFRHPLNPTNYRWRDLFDRCRNVTTITIQNDDDGYESHNALVRDHPKLRHLRVSHSAWVYDIPERNRDRIITFGAHHIQTVVLNLPNATHITLSECPEMAKIIAPKAVSIRYQNCPKLTREGITAPKACNIEKETTYSPREWNW